MARQHQRNSSYPVSPSQYEDSPTFLYSAARPPTNYSAHPSWTPPSAIAVPRHGRRPFLPPPLPVQPRPANNAINAGNISPESNYAPRAPSSSSSSSEFSPPHRSDPNGDRNALPAETPVYARSSWDDPYNASGSDSDEFRSPSKPWLQQRGPDGPAAAGPERRMTTSSRGRSACVADPNRPDSWADHPTAWSKSSFNTNRPRTAAKSALGTVFEEQDYEEKGYYDTISLAPQTAPQTAPSAYSAATPAAGANGQGRVPIVPALPEWYAPKTARLSMAKHSRRSSAPMGAAVYDSPGAMTDRRSMGGDRFSGRQSGQASAGQVHPSFRRNTVGSVFDMNALSAHPYPPEFAPGPGGDRSQPPMPPLPAALPMLSPSKQHQLGRMSVAPARYTLSPTVRALGSAPDRTPATAIQPNGFPPHTTAQNPYVADPFADPPQDPAFDIDEKAAARFHQEQQQQMRGLASGTNPYRDPALGWEPVLVDHLQETQTKNAFLSTFDKVRNSTVGIYYRTYRPFARPLLTISAAMCLSLTMQGPSGGAEWGTMIKLARGGMGAMPPETDGKDVGLGLLGWCALGDQPTCLPYREGDFISTSKKYRIPAQDSSLLDHSANLITALMAVLYLMAAYHLVTAFLHFFLLFGISVPFDHLYTSDPLPPLTGFTAASRKKIRGVPITTTQILQKEVDMRVRCEKDPYEAYYWVWWAWWAHRRSGLGEFFAMIAGLMGICTLGMAVRFSNQVSQAANAGQVSYGSGTFVTLFAFFLALDPFICAIRYLFSAQSSFRTFWDPPEPSVGAIVLPPRAQRLGHRKKPSGTPFQLGNRNDRYTAVQQNLDRMDPHDPQFGDTGTRPGTVNFPLPPPSRASRAATQYRHTMRGEHGQSLFYDPDAPPIPGLPLKGVPQTAGPGMDDLDEETVRWLAAYPRDADLLPLIEKVQDAQRKMAAGQEAPPDDFILSDVGLLYLRPDVTSDGVEQDALLVPPRGPIRDEILVDTHFAIIDEDDETAAHWDAEEMVRQMSETFWWPSMNSDAQAFVAKCEGCGGGQSARRSRALL